MIALAGIWVDYRAVKAAVSMETVLANYGIRLQRLDGEHLRGRCPLPAHASKSSRESFIVNVQKNAWACHSDSCVAARGGRIGGNVLDFVSAIENCSVREAALKLQDSFIVMPPLPPPARNPVAESAATVPSVGNKPLSFALSRIDYSHPYLAERGVDAETIRHFGIGYNCGTGSMAGRVVIPIHDESGLLIAYAGRSVDHTEPKYRFPPRFRKSLALFNLHRAAAAGKSVVVVEGFFDCFNVHQAGLPYVVALMGCSLSLRQEELLQERFQEVVLFLDGDKAGRTAAIKIASRLVSKVSTRIVEIPTGSQPDQLGADQIRCLCIPGYF
ncbi:MAG: toprim domain-containing protein [Bryobacteraceae bacterium]